MALYVLGYWVGIHFYDMVPQFQLYILYMVKFGINFFILHIAVFVKIPFQYINYLYMLRICRPNFMKFKDR